jgi:holliday junction DNA helicase RuvA
MEFWVWLRYTDAMIRYLIGQPKIIGTELVMMCGGVGYGVLVTSETLSKLSTIDNAELHIYTHVTETSLDLFGFASTEALQLFKLLLSVSGVGPRTALNIMNLPTQTIIHAVKQGEVTTFTAVPRVGKKLAQKIIIDLRSKLGEVNQLDLTPLDQNRQSLFDALQGLGFDEKSIMETLNTMPIDDQSLEVSLKSALKLLGKHS